MGSNKKKKSKKREIDDTEINQEQCLALSTEQEIPNDETLNEEQERVRLKRQHTDDDADIEESPKKSKKKKKKTLEPEPETSKKTKKSIRQIKKEKYAKRKAEAEIAAKDELKSQCLSYLSQWKYDKQNWKFMKVKQVWLSKNKFSTHLMPNESWPILLEYFESAKGNIRNLLLEDAHKIIKQMDDWTEVQDKESENNDEAVEDSSEVKKPDDIVYSRARSLIQCLEE